MSIDKTDVLHRICYTALVYERINRKLSSQLSKQEIERMIFTIVREAPEESFERAGKNIYVTSIDKQIKITINANTYRIITVTNTNNL